MIFFLEGCKPFVQERRNKTQKVLKETQFKCSIIWQGQVGICNYHHIDNFNAHYIGSVGKSSGEELKLT